MIIKKQTSNFEILNVCFGKQYSIREIINKLIKKKILTNQTVFLKDKPTINVNILVSNSKIKKVIGWKPSTKIEDSILKTFDWVKANYK